MGVKECLLISGPNVQSRNISLTKRSFCLSVHGSRLGARRQLPEDTAATARTGGRPSPRQARRAGRERPTEDDGGPATQGSTRWDPRSCPRWEGFGNTPVQRRGGHVEKETRDDRLA